MQMLEASHYKKYSSQRFFGIIDTYPPHDKWSNTTHTEPLSIKVRDGKLVINEETILSDSAKFPDRFGLRFITPRECERLQTVPDDYTAYVSDTQRYKMLGNGFTVKVIEHILGGMR
jgi:site-specific DNA-cytosine methylase